MRFTLADQVVSLNHLHLEIDSYAPGSIIAKLKIIGTAVVTTYGLVASYPSFKDGMAMLQEDLNKALQHVIEHAPEDLPDAPWPDHVHIHLRDEEDLLVQVRNAGR